MEPSENGNDFAAWRAELDVSDGKEYRAPGRIINASRAFRFWLQTGGGQLGPDEERMAPSEPEEDGSNPT